MIRVCPFEVGELVLKRYSLASLFFVVAMTAGFLCGWIWGHREFAEQAWKDPPTTTKTYDISAILMQRGRENYGLPLRSKDHEMELYRTLIDELKSKIAPSCWHEESPNRIEIYSPGMAIIVTSNAAIHHLLRIEIDAISKPLSNREEESSAG